MAADAVQPFDAAGAFLRGLAGPKGQTSQEQAPSTPNWMQQKLNMLHYFNLFGKKRG